MMCNMQRRVIIYFFVTRVKEAPKAQKCTLKNSRLFTRFFQLSTSSCIHGNKFSGIRAYD